MSYLKGYTIIDLSLRLPGPLAGKILNDLGANVIKVEDENFTDPFLNGLFNQSDDHFMKWYEKLNSSKKIVRFDFKSEDSKKKISKILNEADALILSLPKKILDLLGLSKDLILKQYPNLHIIELKAGEGRFKNLHDLNALALSGLLDMHIDTKNGNIIAPPFLPVAGICFGHWVATKLLASILAKKSWTEASLQEAVEIVLEPFKSSDKGEPKYLHNGKFPCYSIYKTKDERAFAIAAVEDKFWRQFVDLFELALSMEDRFDTSHQTFEKISNKIRSLNSNEIEALISDKDICLNLI